MTKNELMNVYGGRSFTGALLNIIKKGICFVYSFNKATSFLKIFR